MVAMDTVLITFAFIAAYWLRANLSIFGIPAGIGGGDYRPMYPIVLFSWLTILTMMRQYEPRRHWNLDEICFSIFFAVTVGIMIVIGCAYALRQLLYARLMFGYLWFVGGVLLITSRIVARELLRHLARGDFFTRRVLIAGFGQAAEEIAHEYNTHLEMGYKVIGFVTDEEELENHNLSTLKMGELSTRGFLGNIDNIREIAVSEKIENVIITSFVSSKGRYMKMLEELGALGIKINIVPSIFELAPRHMEFGEIGKVPIIGFRESPVMGWEAVCKRVLDIIGSALGIILLSPLFLIIAIRIKRESPGPVFFAQERIGQNGKPFKMYKFRSMVLSAANDPPVKAKEDDPRVTKIGKFIRKTSIDELPQLFNVIKGDMSLVGPRPETYLYVSQYNGWHKRRLYLRPGLTGQAQALGIRGNTSIDEKTKYDLEYMANQSLLLDIKILIRTIISVLFQKEAY